MNSVFRIVELMRGFLSLGCVRKTWVLLVILSHQTSMGPSPARLLVKEIGAALTDEATGLQVMFPAPSSFLSLSHSVESGIAGHGTPGSLSHRLSLLGTMSGLFSESAMLPLLLHL